MLYDHVDDRGRFDPKIVPFNSQRSRRTVFFAVVFRHLWGVIRRRNRCGKLMLEWGMIDGSIDYLSMVLDRHSVVGWRIWSDPKLLPT